MKVLVLDHGSDFLKELVACVPMAEVRKPGGDEDPNSYRAVIASGGELEREAVGKVLEWYSGFFNRLEKPYLGICLGMRILATCMGASFRRMPAEEGHTRVRFFNDFPLMPGIKEALAFERHEFGLSNLPGSMEAYARSDRCSCQAVSVRGRYWYGVQFHPEKSIGPAGEVIKRFLEIAWST